MIKLPNEIAHMIITIENAGFEAYAVGGCVRDSILGRQPEDWDLASNASRDDLKALFPDAVIVNKKLGVIRIKEEGMIADIAAYRIDGKYTDFRRPETVIFTNKIGEDLRRRDFTMNAIAVSPDRGVVDPFHGQEDIGSKLIRGIGDPRIRFEEDALRILRAIRFAAQLDFEIETKTLRAMKEKAKLLTHISVERIREEFVKAVTSANSGKGLRLFLAADVLPFIFGENCMNNVSLPELYKLTQLPEYIDRSDPETGIRLGLVYLCMKEENADAAIKWLGYSNEMKKLLRYAAGLTDELDGILNKTDLKRFINRVGLESYQFLAKLSVQRHRVYEQDDGTLRRREELYFEIIAGREPVFMEDLAVNGDDLLDIGIKEGAEVGRILKLLLAVVHREPGKNMRELLLKIAAENCTEYNND